MLNNFAARHFKTLARDSAKLDETLKDLTRKLSKLTHNRVPGTANTQNASTVQAPGVHEIYVQRLTGLSGQIQKVRQDHLAVYSREQKNVDREVARAFARSARQSYASLADSIMKTGSTEAIGGVTAWGVYANQGTAPPITDFDAEAELEIDEEWEPTQPEEEQFSPRQLAQTEARPPSAFANFSPAPSFARAGSHANISLNMQGKMPASQATSQAYPGPSQSQHSLSYQQNVSPQSCLIVDWLILGFISATRQSDDNASSADKQFPASAIRNNHGERNKPAWRFKISRRIVGSCSSNNLCISRIIAPFW